MANAATTERCDRRADVQSLAVAPILGTPSPSRSAYRVSRATSRTERHGTAASSSQVATRPKVWAKTRPLAAEPPELAGARILKGPRMLG